MEIDLRGLPVWERPEMVLEALDRLPDGTPLAFITENEPLGLTARISERFSDDGRQLVLESRSVGRGTWRISITRRESEPSRHPVAGLLAATPAFAGLEAVVRDRLAASAISRSARRGRALVEGSQAWPYLGILAEGVAAVVSGGAGERERILHELFPFDAFGLVEFFDRGAPMARVVALSKSARIVGLPWESVAAVAREHPTLVAGLASALAQRHRLLADCLSQSALPILARVARALLPHAMPDRGLSPAAHALASMTQSQIAAAAGTVKEVAARAIAELESRGLLRRERGHIRHLDRQGLVDLIRTLS
ncbi:MAG TPA: helix-turn-helix domain-containing protein [Verrucomicrobiae bacterium]|nr:helix-turn-helix domain-containing protein [Verrucomicrobiae bacterium]